MQRIVCAANRLPTGEILVGLRHWDHFMHDQYEIRTDLYPGLKNLVREWDQGFLDNRGNFLTREEAFVVASNAGQIIKRVGGDEGCLYSENLY